MTDINAAIYRVITSSTKKDVKQDHKTVIQAGYRIEKWNGIGYVVINDETKRKVYIQESTGRRGWSSTTLHYSRNGWGKRFNTVNELLKFDFQGALDKPENEAYYSQKRLEAEQADGINRWGGKLDQLKSARRDVKYETEELAKLQEELAKIQNRISRTIEYKVKAEIRLAEVKKSLGLVK